MVVRVAQKYGLFFTTAFSFPAPTRMGGARGLGKKRKKDTNRLSPTLISLSGVYFSLLCSPEREMSVESWRQKGKRTIFNAYFCWVFFSFLFFRPRFSPMFPIGWPAAGN
jgi:hypothetical protein